MEALKPHTALIYSRLKYRKLYTHTLIFHNASTTLSLLTITSFSIFQVFYQRISHPHTWRRGLGVVKIFSSPSLCLVLLLVQRLLPVSPLPNSITPRSKRRERLRP